jgi:hypothetical protein
LNPMPPAITLVIANTLYQWWRPSSSMAYIHRFSYQKIWPSF